MENQGPNGNDREQLIDFLLKQQIKLDERIGHVTDAVLSLTTILGRAIEHQAEVNELTNKRMEELSQRLNVFIDVVEKHIQSPGHS